MARARQPSTIPHPASSILVLKKSSSNGRGKQEEKWEGWSKGGAHCPSSIEASEQLKLV